MTILVTGACGYLGKQLIDHLVHEQEHSNIVAADIREPTSVHFPEGVTYVNMDVRTKEVEDVFSQYSIETVVHLASVVTPGKNSNAQFEYDVDVRGTERILIACVKHHVARIILTSSGAAYGYHPDNPEWINEDTPLRGHDRFAYAKHKRLVEEMLATYRSSHPDLQQVIFRIGTILGDETKNQITDLFEKRFLIGVRGSKSPFVFIWDQDVVTCIRKAITAEHSGIYNVAGDGRLTIDELGELLNKRVVRLPARMIGSALFVLKRLKLTQYGEEQVDFLRYRPVLSNERLKSEFGYTPTYSTKEVFQNYLQRQSFPGK
ncbi:SDR family oxidoreductase [Geomicrobium sp. JSM 1781026]|uniref:SDR family oxidoreductase n=1 Tax=Geomicrobium sp. JSM 1781026 TaxID=3344580 RepID=UPI0035C03D16